MPRALKLLLGLLLVFVAGVSVLAWSIETPRPAGVVGPEADELARRVERAVGKAGWDELGAVRWKHAGRHAHLWDRGRGFHRVGFGDATVYLDLQRQTGRAERDGVVVTGEAGEALVREGWRWYYNDTFWLIPQIKLFDPGVTRALLPDGRLLVTYGEGGDTPGDAYAWRLGPDGLPDEVQMWVDILPVHGLVARFDRWEDISATARVSRVRHLLRFLPIRVEELSVAGTVAEVEPGPDPFAGMRQ